MPDLPEPLPEYPVHSHAWTTYHWTHDAGKDDDGTVLDAPYQRQSVWDVERRRNLIKSLLIGVPVGAITYAVIPYGTLPERPEATYRIIDGKQRIEAVRAFAADEFTIPGWWLGYRDATPEQRARDLTYSELPAPVRRGFDSAQLPAGEFNSFRTAVPNPAYDPDLRPGYAPKGDPRYPAFHWHHLTNEEALAREAEVYLLINFGGVEQTAADRERAGEIAGGAG